MSEYVSTTPPPLLMLKISFSLSITNAIEMDIHEIMVNLCVTKTAVYLYFDGAFNHVSFWCVKYKYC